MKHLSKEHLPKECRPKLGYLTLYVSNPTVSLDFYQNKLGMTLVDQYDKLNKGQIESHYLLGYLDSLQEHHKAPTSLSLLELIYNPEHQFAVGQHPNLQDGYWKIGISLQDVNVARDLLLAKNIHVSQPKQFLDVGYLCHLTDPDGYGIELLQHHFEQNHTPIITQPQYKLGQSPTLGQITLRITDPDASLKLYCDLLGMRLLSKQIITSYGFTLYFLAYTDEQPPNPNIEAVDNREWLWQRPYTTLELLHNWGAAEEVSYNIGPHTGLHSLTLFSNNLEESIKQLKENNIKKMSSNTDNKIQCDTSILIKDPSNYLVNIT